MRGWRLLAASMLASLTIASAAEAQEASPAFRVPIGGQGSTSSTPPVYAWMETVGTCSNACGEGSRTKSYQCQNVADFDFGGTGYGAPEANSMCTATSPRPADRVTSCTNYSGCSYDWVKPASTITRIAKPNPAGGTYPIGAVDGCSHSNRTFSPYCQRGGNPPVTMSTGDHAFCKNDLPDYADVANKVPDALGYDRNVDDSSACVPGSRDNEWRYGAWSAYDSTCSSTPKRTRSAQCVRKYNGDTLPDSECTGITKTVSQDGPADYSSCGYKWETGAYGAYDNTCSDSAKRTRTVECRRSDGQIVADSSCSSQGAKPATSETTGVYSSCTYRWGTPSAWSAWENGCSSSTSRTRTVECIRSDGKAVPESSCTASGSGAGAKPATAETGSNFDSCTYAPRDQGQTACSKDGTRQQYWDCTRSDGATGFPASYCGKSNPENQTCTPPPPVYTYTAVNRGETACSNGQKQVYWDCTRSDGTTGFAASNCGKTNPETQGCVSYTPRKTGETACSNSQKQVYWDCVGSDGSTAPASVCGKANPETQSCVMPYTYTPRDQGATACSAQGTRQQYWDCTRSDGVTGFPASYCGKSNPENQTCPPPPPTYTYVPVNRGETACSGGQKQVYWDCTRSDGATGFPASNCGKTNPETQSCPMPYTYSPRQTGESACSNGQKQVYWDCTRSDGATGFAASYCGKQASETQGCVSYTPRRTGESVCTNGQKQVTWDCLGSDGSVAAAGACGKTSPETQSCVSYTWNADGWGPYNSTCSATATRTRNVWCQGSDGSRPGDGACSNAGAKPPYSETTAVYSGCGYQTEDVGSGTACTNGSRTIPTQCRRSDGVVVANSFCGNNGSRTETCRVPHTGRVLQTTDLWAQGVNWWPNNGFHDAATFYNFDFSRYRDTKNCNELGGTSVEVQMSQCMYITDNYRQDYDCTLTEICRAY